MSSKCDICHNAALEAAGPGKIHICFHKHSVLCSVHAGHYRAVDCSHGSPMAVAFKL